MAVLQLTCYGPDPEAWEALARRVKRLNDSLPFKSEEDAQEYLDWCTPQDWAEKEPAGFSNIGAGVVDVVTQALPRVPY